METPNNQKNMASTFQLWLSNPAVLIPLVAWMLAWKGSALWRAGRNNQLAWFVVLLVLNTVGLLEIVYLVWFQKRKK